jgi:hypothetical protein
MPVKKKNTEGKERRKKGKIKEIKRVRFKAGKHYNIFGDFFANYHA